MNLCDHSGEYYILYHLNKKADFQLLSHLNQGVEMFLRMKNCVHISVSNDVKVFLNGSIFSERKQLVRLDLEFYYNPYLKTLS